MKKAGGKRIVEYQVNAVDKPLDGVLNGRRIVGVSPGGIWCYVEKLVADATFDEWTAKTVDAPQRRLQKQEDLRVRRYDILWISIRLALDL